MTRTWYFTACNEAPNDMEAVTQTHKFVSPKPCLANCTYDSWLFLQDIWLIGRHTCIKTGFPKLGSVDHWGSMTTAQLAGACRDLMMPRGEYLLGWWEGIFPTLYTHLPNSSIEECEKYRHSKTTSQTFNKKITGGLLK